MEQTSKLPKEQDGDSSFTKLEKLKDKNLQLKFQNNELSVELDRHKTTMRDLIQERDEARRELLAEKLFSKKLMRYFNQIQLSAQTNLANLVLSSNCITDILKVTNKVNHLEKKAKKSLLNLTQSINVNSSVNNIKPSTHKPRSADVFPDETPNVSHVRSPRRASISFQYDALDQEEHRNNNLVNCHQNEGELESDNESKAESEVEIEDYNRLNTITEETGLANSIRSSILGVPKALSEPCFTDAYNDMRLYLSPEIPDNVTKQRGGSSKNSKSKSLHKETSIQKRSSNPGGSNADLSDSDELDVPHLPDTVLSSTRLISPFQKTNEEISPSIDSSSRLDCENSSINKLETLNRSPIETQLAEDELNNSIGSRILKRRGPQDQAVNTKKNKNIRLEDKDEKLIEPKNDVIKRNDLVKVKKTSLAVKASRMSRLRNRNQMLLGSPKKLRPKIGSLKEPNLVTKMRR